MGLFYVEIRKPNGMKNYFGKNNTEVYPSKGKVDEEDAAAAFADKAAAVEAVESAMNHCKSLGIFVSEGEAVELEAQ